jgi:hypothetical protein
LVAERRNAWHDVEMGWRWGVVLTVLGACGRSPFTAASGSSEVSSSDDAATDEGDSNDGPTVSDGDDRDDGDRDDDTDDSRPGDDPRADVGSELPPPGFCADAPALPAGPGCDDVPTEQRLLFQTDASQGILTVDDEWIYFAANRSEPRLYRVDKCSGEAELLASEGMNPGNIVVVDDRVIWTDYDEPGSVWQVPKDGGDPVAIAELSWPLALAVADDWIFFSANEGLFRTPRAGGDVETWLGPDHWFVTLSYDGALLFGNDDFGPSIAWVDPLDASYGAMVTPNYRGDVVADCEHMFWANEFGELQRTNRSSGITENLGIQSYRFTQDTTHVFASTGETQVLAVDKQSGETETVGDVPGETPWRVAVDETHVYWSSAYSGGLWVAPKP